MGKRVLVVSQSEDVVSAARGALVPLGCDVVARQGLASGLRAMDGGELVFLDLKNGLAALREIKSYHPEALVVLLCGAGGDCYASAIEDGAYDCLEKPLDPVRLRAAARNALKHLSLREEVERHMRSRTPELTLGPNEKMVRVLRQVRQAASKDTHVLIMGEKGTGKELVAKAVHLGSHRASGPFLPVDASSGSLAEGLFGSAAAPGTLVAAEGGTVFLKDFGNPEAEDAGRLQAFLAERRFTPRGLDEHIKADVRVICSVNGAALGPSFVALFPTVLKLPPLRERPEDIAPLAVQFLSEASALFGTGPVKLSKEATRALQKYTWPGNVGELKAVMTRACLLARGARVEARHLALEEGSPYYSVKEFLKEKLGRYIKDLTRLGNTGLYGAVLSEVEKSLIEIVLEETGGNQLRAASALGINRTTLRTKMRNYKISQKSARPARSQGQRV